MTTVNLNHSVFVYGTSKKLEERSPLPKWMGTPANDRAVKICSTVIDGKYHVGVYQRFRVVANQPPRIFGFVIDVDNNKMTKLIDACVERLELDFVTVSPTTGKKRIPSDNDLFCVYSDLIFNPEAFVELSRLYGGSPGLGSHEYAWERHIERIVKAIVQKRIREFNNTAVAQASNRDVLTANKQLRTTIQQHHMKQIKAVCSRLKLSVNDYLYALQDVIDNPQSVLLEASPLTIID